MPRSKSPSSGPKKPAKKPIEQYEHRHETRVNNPPVGLVKSENDPDSGKKAYEYDPHLDPQLVWAGKAEHTSFEVPTVSLHVHERIDPKTILEAVKKKNGEAARGPEQLSMFERPEEKAPLREALDFYKHAHGWSNRLIAGDSLLVMNSLLEKEGMAGKVQMIYLDPPYGIGYASNFQPFVNNRTVKDRDEDLTQEPETIKAFRDTWNLNIHSYLTYTRDRLLLSRELLAPSGSIFVQIGQDNLHIVRTILDEVMGVENFIGQVVFRKKMMPLSKKPGFESMGDFILWYSKVKAEGEKRFNKLFVPQKVEGDQSWRFVEEPDGRRRELTPEELVNHRLLRKGSRVYQSISMKPREYRPNQDFNFDFEGTTYPPPGGRIERTPDGIHCWSTTSEGMQELKRKRRLQADGNSLRYVLFHDDYPVMRLTGTWNDTAPPKDMKYVVETAPIVVQRCMLAATNPGDLVLDPTCGSGTTAFVAEQWGRRWITCDTLRVSIALAKQRLMTAVYKYYQLAHPEEGVRSGFNYKTIPHLKLGSIVNQEPVTMEHLFDDPHVDPMRARVTGPFTVEAVPAPVVKPLDLSESRPSPQPADASAARSGATLRHAEWREELLKTGIRGKSGQRILFSRVEPLSGTRWLHAEAQTAPNDIGSDHISEGAASAAQRVVLSFGPEHAPLEQKQVERAWQEALSLYSRPALLVFAAFQFDPEAAKDIDELTPDKAGMTLLKAQMNPDLLTEDLKKKRASNESFWLVGQPDVELRRVELGEHAGKWQVEVRGFDYYNTKNGEIEAGDVSRIALWMLDPDYDDRSLFPRQVFLPMAGDSEGWARLANSLRAEVDEEAIEAYRGTISLPFAAEPGQRVAIKLVDDRGIESLRILGVE